VIFNSIGMSRLTQADRDELSAMRIPPDDGSGRTFDLDDDTVDLVYPDGERINVARMPTDEESAEERLRSAVRTATTKPIADADRIAALASQLEELSEALRDANEVNARVMRQRDIAIETLEKSDAERDQEARDATAELMHRVADLEAENAQLRTQLDELTKS
jgi:flagellar biosynthesis/type III secretory pathway chaperone